MNQEQFEKLLETLADITAPNDQVEQLIGALETINSTLEKLIQEINFANRKV